MRSKCGLWKIGIYSLVAAALLILGYEGAGSAFNQKVHAQEQNQDIVEIYTFEELEAMSQNPYGNYMLMEDIDLAGRAWKPFDFYGSFDGNNHALLNLTISSLGESTRVTYDGNMKPYDTYFGAMFTQLSNATVSNLQLLNVRVSMTAENKPCFLAPVAGYVENSIIENCTIQGSVTLEAHDRMFGVGGIVGYGYGTLRNVNTAVELVCIDTDALTKDEQFLGGAYGAGYLDMENCTIQLEGFISEHGYVHSGGAVGMYILYPQGLEYAGYINHNKVIGKITFFEDNRNRRAYCKDFIGEVLNWTYEYVGNSAQFEKDERFEYDTVLKPHMCETNTFEEEVFLADYQQYGYTLYTCTQCGYQYRDHYQLKSHTYEWKTEQEPPVEISMESSVEASEPAQEIQIELKASEEGQSFVENRMLVLAAVVSILIIIVLFAGIIVFVKHK